MPELRLLWWLIASIGSLVSPSNFASTRATSPTTAKTNGSWYIDACGPWGAELLPYGKWKRGSTPRASRRSIRNIFDSYAASIIDLNERIGAGRDPFFAQYVQAAHQWQSVDPSNMEERALAFIYHYAAATCATRPRRTGSRTTSPRGTRTWTPTRSRAPRRSSCTTRAAGSSTRSSRPGGRWMHNVGYQFQACGADKVWCKKEKISA